MPGTLSLTNAPHSVAIPQERAKINTYLGVGADNVPECSKADFYFYPQKTYPIYKTLSRRLLNFDFVIRAQILL